MSKRTGSDYLLHITEAISRIVSYTEGMTYEEFFQDTKPHDAVIRNIEIIGEASKNISENITQEIMKYSCPRSSKEESRLIFNPSRNKTGKMTAAVHMEETFEKAIVEDLIEKDTLPEIRISLIGKLHWIKPLSYSSFNNPNRQVGEETHHPWYQYQSQCHQTICERVEFKRCPGCHPKRIHRLWCQIPDRILQT